MTASLFQLWYGSDKQRAMAVFLVPNTEISKTRREQLKNAHQGTLTIGPNFTSVSKNGKKVTDTTTQDSIIRTISSLCGNSSLSCLKTKYTGRWNKYQILGSTPKFEMPVTHLYSLGIIDI